MPMLSLYQRLLRRRYENETLADELHRVPTTDGLRVALKRFLPNDDVERRHLPVLLVPGLGADSHNFDAPAPIGLAPYLAEHGFDTFVVDLRGTGLSHVPRERWSQVCFDDFLQLDVPAVDEKIQQLTGRHQRLHLGHSMGGMLLYAAMATGRAGHIKAGVTVGTPVGFPHRWQVAPLLRPFRHLGEWVPGLFMRDMSRLVTPLLTLSDRWPGLNTYVELSNMEPKMAQQLLFQAVQDIPRALLLQFRDWVEHDAFRSQNHDVDYRAQLMGTQTPVLAVAGPADKLGTPKAVERICGLSSNVEYMLCGKAQGFSADYGHADLLLGAPSRDEVFPKLLDFLVRHDDDAKETTSTTSHLRVL